MRAAEVEAELARYVAQVQGTLNRGEPPRLVAVESGGVVPFPVPFAA